MSASDFSRRDFHRLSLAALGGALSGAYLSSCHSAPEAPEAAGEYSAMISGDKHACKGLNTCQGKGAGGGNQCAGMGKCATASHHACRGLNDCAGRGGCGEAPGANSCKGQGHCAVPLSDAAWKRARANFETAMAAAGKQFGSAP